MVVTYYIKLFRTGADRHNGILMSLSLLIAELIIWPQKRKKRSVAKIKIKACFSWTAFMIDYVSAYKSQMAFMRLDLEIDKPRMNAELRVMMVEI